MNGPLSTATIVASLLLAAWCAVTALLNRPPGRGQLVAVLVLEVIVVALGGTAVVELVGGARIQEPTTFIGYLITLVCLPPTGWVLAKMEPTRWGTVTLGVAVLIVPVLVLRLQQVWTATGG